LDVISGLSTAQTAHNTLQSTAQVKELILVSMVIDVRFL